MLHMNDSVEIGSARWIRNMLVHQVVVMCVRITTIY